MALSVRREEFDGDARAKQREYNDTFAARKRGELLSPPLKAGPDAEYERTRKTRYRANKKDWKPPEFICVDGEGAGDGPEHKYVLLGVGEEQYDNPEGIHWKEAFEFLYTCFERNPNAVYAGFFLSYDWNQILKTLPQNRAAMLLTQKGINARRRKNSKNNRKPFSVRCDEWELDMLPGRRLQLRPLRCNCYAIPGRDCKHNRPRWMYICDAGSFWQTSLVSVLNPEKWETPVCSRKSIRKSWRARQDGNQRN